MEEKNLNEEILHEQEMQEDTIETQQETTEETVFDQEVRFGVEKGVK